MGPVLLSVRVALSRLQHDLKTVDVPLTDASPISCLLNREAELIEQLIHVEKHLAKLKTWITISRGSRRDVATNRGRCITRGDLYFTAR